MPFPFFFRRPRVTLFPPSFSLHMTKGRERSLIVVVAVSACLGISGLHALFPLPLTNCFLTPSPLE